MKKRMFIGVVTALVLMLAALLFFRAVVRGRGPRRGDPPERRAE